MNVQTSASELNSHSDMEQRKLDASPFLKLVDLQIIPSESGTLSIAEMSAHIGFPVLRTYFLTDVPAGGGRGGHAHKKLKQGFICLRGEVTLAITKDDESVTVHLNHFQKLLVVEPGCWRDLYNFSSDALVLVLASEEYDERDYIRSYQDFIAWERSQRLVPVPYLDLARHVDLTHSQVAAQVHKVIASGAYIGGSKVQEFEAAFAKLCNTRHAVGVGNGLEALSLALRGWGIGPGDEVIVPAQTFIATALAVEEVGAVPVLVDVELPTGLMDVSQVRAALTPRTKAVIPVHLYGHPVDMDGLYEAIALTDVKVLEDACQAHGATYKGLPVGGLGHAAAFSFYPTKNLGALGDGGALVTNDALLADTVRQLANYGSAQRYHHEVRGVNSRLDALHAAALSAKLPYLGEWNAARTALADRYLRGLQGIPGLTLPVVHSWAASAWHVFAVLCGEQRNELQAHLRDCGIGTNIHYPVAIHQQACYRGLWEESAFPNAVEHARGTLSLPLDVGHTESEIDRVITGVRRYFETISQAAQ